MTIDSKEDTKIEVETISRVILKRIHIHVKGAVTLNVYLNEKDGSFRKVLINGRDSWKNDRRLNLYDNYVRFGYDYYMHRPYNIKYANYSKPSDIDSNNHDVISVLKRINAFTNETLTNSLTFQLQLKILAEEFNTYINNLKNVRILSDEELKELKSNK